MCAVSGQPVTVLHLLIMPAPRPHYTITDTGHTRSLLDDAQRHWPEVADRKELLLRLAQAGHGSLGLGEVEVELRDRPKRQRVVLERLPALVDLDVLLTDHAWD